jgi:hypothetical protein
MCSLQAGSHHAYKIVLGLNIMAGAKDSTARACFLLRNAPLGLAVAQ